MDNVITLDLNGPSNQMMMLFSRYGNTVLYVVNNASCYASAIEAIAIKEDMTQRQVDDIIYSQNCKKFKVKFLKEVGYQKLSALSMAELNNKIMQHFNMEVQ